MGRRGKDTYFKLSARNNALGYKFYLDRLTELAITMFTWDNLPDEIDERFLEVCLFTDGKILFFKDDIIGHMVMQFSSGGELTIYRVPTIRNAYAVNGYNNTLYTNNSVIIWNNYLRENSVLMIENFAMQLWELDQIIRINANAQKTPVLVQGTENQRLTLMNLYKEYSGNSPVIFGDKNLDINGLKSISTLAPFVADKLYELKTNIWNEALTSLGIPNVSIQKKERLVTDEVNRTMGGVIASRYSRLKMREKACKEINKMFGLNVECHVVDFDDQSLAVPDNVSGFEGFERLGDSDE